MLHRLAAIGLVFDAVYATVQHAEHNRTFAFSSSYEGNLTQSLWARWHHSLSAMHHASAAGAPIEVQDMGVPATEDTYAKNLSRFDALGPTIQCPPALDRIIGTGPSSKRICVPHTLKEGASRSIAIIAGFSQGDWEFVLKFLAEFPLPFTLQRLNRTRRRS